MPMRVLVVAPRLERSPALQRLSHLVVAAWKENRAHVDVVRSGLRLRARLRPLLRTVEIVHVIDHLDAAQVPGNHGSARVVVHCHNAASLIDDLGLRTDGQLRPHPLRRAQARATARAMVRADRVLVSSRTTGEEIARITEREAELLPPPVDPNLARPGSGADAPVPPWPYVLAVCDSRPDDRRVAVITAWAALRRTAPLDGSSLVVVGDPLTDEEENLVLGCGGHVAVRSDLDDHELAALYRGAKALVHLARPTGFPWPVAEAHCAGCPVLATDALVVEEAGQSGCVYLPVEGVGRFDPATWSSIAEDLTSRIVAERAADNAGRFDWRSFVDRLPIAAGVGPTGTASASDLAGALDVSVTNLIDIRRITPPRRQSLDLTALEGAGRDKGLEKAGLFD